jgi:glycosyltransferase involved in cell wall biosynthesis
MKENLLTILIPAFNSYKGVVNIVRILKNQKNITIIISDDSNDNKVAYDIKDYITELKQSNIRYVRHKSTSNPVDNWNSLLAKVDSKFFMVVHHDETFSNTLFVDFLDRNKNYIDFMVLPISIRHSKSVVRNVSSQLQKVIYKLFNKHGPAINFLLGPCSILVVKTDFLVYFDRDLVQYVDNEWYKRTFDKVRDKKVTFFSKTKVISTISENSITKKIAPRLKAIIDSDLKILKDKYPENIFLKKTLLGYFYDFLFKVIILYSFIPFYIRRMLHALTRCFSR